MYSKIRWFYVGCALVLMVLFGFKNTFAQETQPGVCYASTGGNGSNPASLFTIDLQSGAGTLVDSTGLSRIPSIAINSNGEIYGLDGWTGNIYRIFPGIAVDTLVFQTGLDGLRTIAFDGSDVLYGRYYGSLYTIDLDNKTVVNIGGQGFDASGMDFDPIDGSLWAGVDTLIFKIDVNTGLVEYVGSTGIEHRLTDIVFDSEGNLYGAVGGGNLPDNEFVAIDKTTGLATKIGNIGFQSVSGLSFYKQQLSGPQLAFSASSLNFGNVVVSGQGKTRSVVLKNIGSEDLEITGIDASNTVFELLEAPDLPLTLASGIVDTIDVIFRPQEGGTIEAELTFTSNDSDNATKQVLLKGNGLALELAEAGACYASTGLYGNGNLLSIDLSSGYGSLIGSTGINRVPALAIDTSGVIYGGSENRLYYIDAATGQAYFALNLNTYRIGALAFNLNGELYGSTISQGLYKINKNTGETVRIGNISYRFRGLAFDPLDDILWGAVNDQIYTIDVNTAETTLIGSTGINSSITDIAFDSEGNLYAMAGGARNANNMLLSINKDSGEGTIVGTTGFTSVSGLAFLPEKLEGPQIGLSSARIDFGTVLLDSSSSSKKIIFKNIGNEDLVVSDISLSDSQFTLAATPTLPLTLQPSELDSIHVIFSPSDSGDVESTITITSNDADSEVRVIKLHGYALQLTPAELGTCYAINLSQFNYNPSLITLDVNNASHTQIGALTIPLSKIAINSKGVIVANDGGNALYYIDARNGRVTFAVSTELPRIDALAFGLDNLLYAANHQSIYTIDLNSGRATLVGTFSNTFNAFKSIAIDPIDHLIWAVTANQLYVLDVPNASINLVGEIGLPGSLNDIHFNNDGILFGIVDAGYTSNDQLITIDKVNGSGEIIGTTDFDFISSIAFRPVRLSGAQLGLSSTSINFGTTLIGDTTYAQNIILRNIGTEDVTVLDISLSDTSFILTTVPKLPLVLSPGHSDSLAMVFAPYDTGFVSDSLLLTSNDLDTPTKAVRVRGKGESVAFAETGVFYASMGQNGTPQGGLIQLDPVSGAGQLIGATGLQGVPSIAINSRGIIYGTNLTNATLYFIDAQTGAATWALSPNVSNLTALAFNKNDVLFGISFGQLVKIDTQSGRTTVIGNTGIDFRGMAFDPIDEKLWAVIENQIYTIDPITATSTLVGQSDLDGESFTDIHFDSDGNLYGTVGGGRSANNRLVAIDKSNGTTNLIGLTGYSSVGGLAYFIEELVGPHIGVNISTIDFGIELVDSTSSPRFIILKNIGSEELNIDDISLPAGPFTITHQPELPLSLNPGQSDTLQITFAPTADGLYSSEISITSDDPDDAVKKIILKGEGFKLNPAIPGGCYAAIQSSYQRGLVSINPVSGAGTFIGDSETGSFGTLAINPGGIIYTSGSNTRELDYVDAATGEATFAIKTELNRIDAMAFGNDKLYASDYYQLYTIDVETGVATSIGNPNQRFIGLAVNPVDGKLWGCTGGYIYTIDDSTGETTEVGQTRLDGSLRDIHFDNEGNLYGIQDTGIDQLIKIEKFNGKGTVIGPTGFNAVSGLAFFNQPVTGKQLSVSSNIMDFDVVLVDSLKQYPLEIRSIGTDTVTVTDISFEIGEVFSIADLPTLPLVLQPGQADTFRVTFRPDTAVIFTDKLIINSNDEDQVAKEVELQGDGFQLTPADSGIFYALYSRSYSSRALLKIDITAGISETVATLNLSSPNSLAINSQGYVYVGINNALYYLNPYSGELVRAVETELSRIDALVFDNHDNLYAVYGSQLYQINLNTGTVDSGEYLGTSITSLAFDPTDNTLWGVMGVRIYKRNATNGQFEIIGSGNSGVSLSALHFDNDGNLFATEASSYNSNTKLFAINKITGKSSELSSLNVGGISSMAYRHYKQQGPQISTSAKAMDFGTVLLDSLSAAETIMIKNFGTENLTITDVFVPDSNFIVSHTLEFPVELMPDSSKTISVSFKPNKPGIHSDILEIISNDANTDTAKITLSGQGFQITPADSGAWYSVRQSRNYYPYEYDLVTFNLQSGALTTIGKLDLTSSSRLAIDNTGRLFAQNGYSIYILSTEDGKMTEFVRTNLSSIRDIAFDDSNNLYALRYNNIYQIDLETGEDTYISINNMPEMLAITFDPVEKVFWGITYNSNPRALYKIDVEKRTAVIVGDTNLRRSVLGLQFNSEGNLYALVSGDNSNSNDRMVIFDKITGMAHEVGTLQNAYLNSLAYYVQRLTGKQLYVSTPVLNFGATIVDSTSTPRYLRIQNIGDEDLTLSGIEMPEGEFSLVDSLTFPLSLPEGERRTLGLIFSPVDTGYKEVVIAFNSDDMEQPLKQVKLYGNGLKLNLAEQDICYASLGQNADNPGSIITINPKTGAGTYLALTGLQGIPGLAINSQGLMVGVEARTSSLYYIDAKTGISTPAITLSLNQIDALVFDDKNNLYGASSYNGDLYKINLNSGEAEFITRLNYDIKGLAYDSSNNMLWTAHGRYDQIYKIDLTSKQSTLVGNTGLAGYTTDLHFDKDGNLYAIKGGGREANNRLISIDVNTGAGTVIGDIGFRSVSGFAFANLKDPNLPSSVALDDIIPSEFTLSQNYPNPFNPTTKIRFAIAEKSHVRLAIYNIRGQVVRTLVDEERNAKTYEEIWDARNDNGLLQASGIYFVRLITDKYSFSRTMIFVK